MDKLQHNILDISHNNYEYLINLENVSAVGLGYKVIKGITTFEPCLHVLVNKKIDSKYITQNNLIPSIYMGIKTDVIEVGEVKQYSPESLITNVRPLEGGYSIMSGNKITGTLGCMVKRISKGKLKFYILSNNHVLAGSNSLSIGSPVMQPSSKFGGNPVYDKVATLSKYVPIKYQTKFSKPVNYADCAIAKIINPYNISPRIKHLGTLRGIAEPVLYENVSKVGMSSGLTTGFVATIGMTCTVGDSSGKKIAFYKDQIRASLHTEPGDSGSVIVNSQNKVIGLFFSGAPGNVAYFSSIKYVLEKLDIEIYSINIPE